MEEKYRHFLFGIVASVGLCFIILVFFTGEEVCINSKLLNIGKWILFGLICVTVILLLFLAFVIIANHGTRDIKNTKWHIVTECSQDQELRSKRKLLFHPEVTVFPNSVISYCETVEQVEFAGSDCYFMAGSFEGCANLEYIKLPHRLERIPDNMFKNCSSLKEIIIPSTVKSIGKNAFDGCRRLTSVVFEESSKLESIGDSAFSECSGLTSVEIPAGVVDSGLFPVVTGECRVVVTGEITGSTVEKLRAMIDRMSAGAKIRLDLSQTTGLTSIGTEVFRGCSRLTSVEIPAGVTSIGDDAFSGCSGLSSVEIPAGVTSIGERAFDGCSGLTSAEIPAGVVDPGLFPAVTGECRVVVTGEITDSTVEKLRSMIDGMSAGAKIRLDLSQTTGLTSIGSSAFEGCSGLTSVTFGEGSKLESIGCGAFKGCKRLTSVTFGDTSEWYVTKSETGAAKEAGDKIVELNSEKPTRNAKKLVKKYADRYWYKKK